jgi:hypothetical protein
VDNRAEVRDFLTSRRGEVACLAGVSVEYLTRLERGNLTGDSEDI